MLPSELPPPPPPRTANPVTVEPVDAEAAAGRAWIRAVNASPVAEWMRREDSTCNAEAEAANANATFLAIASAFDAWSLSHLGAGSDRRTLPLDAIMATAHAANRCVDCERSGTTMALAVDFPSAFKTRSGGVGVVANVRASHHVCVECLAPPRVTRPANAETGAAAAKEGRRLLVTAPAAAVSATPPAGSRDSATSPMEQALADPADSDAAYLLAQAQYLAVRLESEASVTFTDVIRAAVATIGTLPALRPPPMSAGLHLIGDVLPEDATSRGCSIKGFDVAVFAQCRITRLVLEHLNIDADAMAGIASLPLRHLVILGTAAGRVIIPSEVSSPASGRLRLVDTLHTLVLKSSFHSPLQSTALHACRRLEHVTLHGASDVDALLASLGQCTSLRTVRIRSEKELEPIFSDAGLMGVASETLERLQVEVQRASGPFTQAGSTALAQRCPRLHTLGLAVGFGQVKFHDEGFMAGLGSIPALRRVKLIASAVALGPFGRALAAKGTGAPVMAVSTMSVSGYARHIVQQLIDAPHMAAVRVGGGSSQQVKAEACPAAWEWLVAQGLVRPRQQRQAGDAVAHDVLARALFDFDA